MSVRKFIDKQHKFVEAFDTKTGQYVRSGIIDQDGKDTNIDAFMRSFPALLDIGIMGGCKAQGLCRAGGKHSGCYQGGKKYDPSKDMKLADYKKIIDEGARYGLMQVALGGAGNPNDHADFEAICAYTREHNIVPNYTTAGISLSEEAVAATKAYCGAVAVSWYGQQFTSDAITAFVEAGCKTNVHYVVSKETIDDAIRLLDSHTLPYDDKIWDFEKNPINAIVFLLYKPVGLGTRDNVLSAANDEAKIKEFYRLVTAKRHPFKTGFDSCSIPAVINYSDHVDMDSVDTCEGGRFSAYISPDMVMLPCSFDQKRQWGIDLHSHTLKEAWESAVFDDFRSRLRQGCPDCPTRYRCMGGCPIENSIVLCNKEERKCK